MKTTQLPHFVHCFARLLPAPIDELLDIFSRPLRFVFATKKNHEHITCFHRYIVTGVTTIIRAPYNASATSNLSYLVSSVPHGHLSHVSTSPTRSCQGQGLHLWQHRRARVAPKLCCLLCSSSPSAPSRAFARPHSCSPPPTATKVQAVQFKVCNTFQKPTFVSTVAVAVVVVVVVCVFVVVVAVVAVIVVKSYRG